MVATLTAFDIFLMILGAVTLSCGTVFLFDSWIDYIYGVAKITQKET